MLKCNLSCDAKLDFSASLLQSPVSHDPSEIIIIHWFAAHENFWLIMFNTIVLLHICVKKTKIIQQGLGLNDFGK